MNDWMMKLSTVLLGVGLLAQTSALGARGCCLPCEPTDNLCVSVEVLYWKPITAPYDYGLIETDTNNDFLSLKPDYSWGGRASAIYANPCCFAGVSYSWYRAHDAIKVAHVPGLSLVSFDPSEDLTKVIARLFFQYQNLDARLGRILYQSCGGMFYVFGGLQGALINQRKEVVANFLNPTAGQFKEIHKSTFKGIGPSGGIGGVFTLWKDWKGFGQLGASALIGEQKTPREFLEKVQTLVSTDKMVGTYPSYTTVVPGIDLRVGLNYLANWLGLETRWEVGYEIDYYFNALNVVNQAGNALITDALPLRTGR